MGPSRWLLRHPMTSDEAAQAARQAFTRSLWMPFVLLVILIAMTIVLNIATGDSGLGMSVWPVVVGSWVFYQASALVYKEAYHRLKAEGK